MRYDYGVVKRRLFQSKTVYTETQLKSSRVLPYIPYILL